MPQKKKFSKYEISTPMHWGFEHRMMEHYTDFVTLLNMHEKTLAATGETWNRFGRQRAMLNEGNTVTLADLRDWDRTMLRQSAFLSSPEFDALNEKVMAEYDSREDLQEMYKACVADMYWVADRYGKRCQTESAEHEAIKQRPTDYRMLAEVANSNSARNMRETSRETGFQEGDLVLLRKPYVGNCDIDPMWVNPYSQEAREGASTPDADTPRIGTVIAVTDQLSRSWNAPKGSRILKILWMGKEDIVNVELRYIKWHERPTLKNGLKTRE